MVFIVILVLTSAAVGGFISVLTGVLLCFTAAGSLELNGSVGGNITIHCGVKDFGILKHNETHVMLVQNNVGESVSNKTNKYQWNNTTGCFTITDLEKADAGILMITFSNMTSVTYPLIVYDPVAPPAVQTLSVSSDSCYLLCAVDKAAEITQSWYKDQEVVNQSSSAGSLPLTVTKQDLSSSYRCVAGNPAENKTLLVDLQKVCGENFTNSSSENNHSGNDPVAPPAGNKTNNSSSENNHSPVSTASPVGNNTNSSRETTDPGYLSTVPPVGNNTNNSSSENNHSPDWIKIGVPVGCAGLFAFAAIFIWWKCSRTNTPTTDERGSMRYVIGNTSPDSQNQGEDEGGNDDSCHVMLDGDTQDTSV